MTNVPMGHFDLTIADPPYGIGRDWERRNKSSQQFSETYNNTERPSPEVFNEIIRVSKHWIIWGWNYFTDILPPSNYLIVWDKMSNCNQTFHYSKAEIAGTDIKIPCNLVAIPWDGYRMGEETGQKKSIRTKSRSRSIAGSWRPTGAGRGGFSIRSPVLGASPSRVSSSAGNTSAARSTRLSTRRRTRAYSTTRPRSRLKSSCPSWEIKRWTNSRPRHGN